MSPIVSALLPILADAGAPLVQRVLTRQIGDAEGRLAADMLGRIAASAAPGGVVEDLPQVAARSPEAVRDALRQVEQTAPEIVALYAAGLEKQFALLRAETRGPWWGWAWRPAWMWGLGAVWVWALMAAPVLRATVAPGLERIDAGMLFQLTGVFLGLYMGGHTIKDLAARRGGAA